MSCGRCKGTLSTSIIIDDVIEIFYVLNFLEHLYSLFIYCTAHLDNMCHGDSLSNKSTCNTGKITILKDLGFSCFTRQLLFFRFFWKRSSVHQHKCIKKKSKNTNTYNYCKLISNIIPKVQIKTDDFPLQFYL